MTAASCLAYIDVMSTAADGKWKDPFREELSAWWKVLWDIGMFFRGLFCWCVGM